MLAALVLAGGIADARGAAAHQRDRPVAGLLQPVQHHDRQQRADMQRGRGAVEADIGGDRPSTRERIERVGLRHLVDEAAARENVKEIGLIAAHRLCSPSGGWCNRSGAGIKRGGASTVGCGRFGCARHRPDQSVGKHLGQDIPMCGVPVVRADEFLQRLIRQGYRVAVPSSSRTPARGLRSTARGRGAEAQCACGSSRRHADRGYATGRTHAELSDGAVPSSSPPCRAWQP